MKKVTILIIVLALGWLTASAQLKKYRWDTEFCAFEGTYDAKKLTPAVLKNTLRLYSTQDFEFDTIDATVFKYSDLATLRTVASLDAEYKQKSAALKALKIAATPFWTEFKQKKIKALEAEYKLARVSVEAYKNPPVLKTLDFAGECITNFANPLIAGGDALLSVWRKVNEETRRQNADPERIRREYEAQLASPDRINYARVEVTTFGWWNCVNAKIERGEYDETAIKNFKSLFKKVRQIRCDEP